MSETTLVSTSVSRIDGDGLQSATSHNYNSSLMCILAKTGIDGHAARDPLARPEARYFGPGRAWHDTVLGGPGPAWPDV